MWTQVSGDSLTGSARRSGSLLRLPHRVQPRCHGSKGHNASPCPILILFSVSFVLWFMADNKDSDKIISLPMFTGHSRGLSTPSPAGKSTVELDKRRAKRTGSY
ncbi:hypothetical protein EJB05_54781, partial [Eragrostis curvula]